MQPGKTLTLGAVVHRSKSTPGFTREGTESYLPPAVVPRSTSSVLNARSARKTICKSQYLLYLLLGIAEDT
jgi:hypothetical protein